MKASVLLGKYYHEPIPDVEISGICYDTRDMKKDSVFVCIKGVNEDGHKYAARAALLGARIIIASENVDCSAAVILTDDTKAALKYLIKRFYGKPELTLYGVTGTNGKTTVTHMIAAILNAAGKSCGVIGTNGTFLNGEELKTSQNTPTTPNMPELYAILAEMKARGAECAVMEVTSHALVQGRVEGLTFDAGVFTNLTQDHLDFHKDMEDYFEAKKKLFAVCDNAAVNVDDEYGRRIAEEYPCAIGYGIENGNVRAENVVLGGDGAEFELLLGEKRIKQRINVPGLFSVYNALAAACCCYASGIDADAVSKGLQNVKGICGRMERIDADGVDVVIDYAHTPDGLEKVLDALKNAVHGRVICVFGCGGDRDRKKRPQMGKIAVSKADIAMITSDNPRTEPPTEIIIDILTGVRSDNYIVIENREKAINAALAMARRGDTVLLAGKGQERYQIVGREKRHFDEREIVERFVQRRKDSKNAEFYH